MSNNVDEARKVIEELRQKRTQLGDTTNTKVKLHYKRLQRPKVAALVWNFYMFLAGMLLSATLLGANVFWLFIGIMILIGITYMRE